MEKSELQLKTSTSTSSLTNFERSPEEFESSCLICAESFGKEHLRCVVNCGHNDVCAVCYLRLRALQRNFSCPSCKAELEAVICVEKDTDRFTDFSIWGDSIGPDHMYDERSKIFFPKQYFKAKVESLFACSCRVQSCRQTRRDMKSLRQHMLIDHKMNFCLLCIEHKQSFPAEQKVYTQANYEIHLRDGDGDGGHGHPLCQFCRKRYYDKTDLFVHLSRDHFSCFLCERQGIQFKYFEDYKSLEDHFRTSHFICEDSLCLCKRFVVFANSIDLAAHVLSVHPFQQASRNIPIHFKVRRPTASGYERDRDREGGAAGSKSREEEEEEEFLRGGSSGSSSSGRPGQHGGAGSSNAAFEGGMGGRVRGGEWQVELPPTVGDPRGAARSTGTKGPTEEEVVSTGDGETNPFITMGRAPIEQCPEEYPALAKQGGGGPLTIGGWNSTLSQGSSGGRNDFPELSAPARSGSSSGSGAAKSFMKATRGPSISSKGVGGSSGIISTGKAERTSATAASINAAVGGASSVPNAAFGSEPSPDGGRWAAHINVKKDKRLKNHFSMGKSASTGGEIQAPTSPIRTENDEWQSATGFERIPSTDGLSGFDVVDDLDAAAIAAAVASAEEELNHEEALAALTRKKNKAVTAAGAASSDTVTGGSVGVKKKASGVAITTSSSSAAAAAMGWGGALKIAGVSSSQKKKQPVKTGLSMAKPLTIAKTATASAPAGRGSASSVVAVGSTGSAETAGDGGAAALRSLDALKPIGRLHRDLEDSQYLKTSSSNSSLNALLGPPPGLGLPAPPPNTVVASNKRGGSSDNLVGIANQPSAHDFPAFPLAPPSSNSNSNKIPVAAQSSNNSNIPDVGSRNGNGGGGGKSKMGWTKTGGTSETTASSSSSRINNNNSNIDQQDYPALGGGAEAVTVAGGKGTTSSTKYAAAATTTTTTTEQSSKVNKRGDANGNNSNGPTVVPKQPQHPAVSKKKRSELQELCMIRK